METEKQLMPFFLFLLGAFVTELVIVLAFLLALKP